MLSYSLVYLHLTWNQFHSTLYPMEDGRETCPMYVRGRVYRSVVRAPDSWSKGRGFESLQEWRENFLLQGQLSVLTVISVSVPPPVARKRPRSFRQKCRWQVIAKHAYTLRMWLCMKWHGAWLYGVHRTCAETAPVSCGTSHASAVSTPLRWIFKNVL